jgi:hypothetical protein
MTRNYTNSGERLIEAARKGERAKVEALIAQGINVEYQDTRPRVGGFFMM